MSIVCTFMYLTTIINLYHHTIFQIPFHNKPRRIRGEDLTFVCVKILTVNINGVPSISHDQSTANQRLRKPGGSA